MWGGCKAQEANKTFRSLGRQTYTSLPRVALAESNPSWELQRGNFVHAWVGSEKHSSHWASHRHISGPHKQLYRQAGLGGPWFAVCHQGSTPSFPGTVSQSTSIKIQKAEQGGTCPLYPRPSSGTGPMVISCLDLRFASFTPLIFRLAMMIPHDLCLVKDKTVAFPACLYFVVLSLNDPNYHRLPCESVLFGSVSEWS